MKFLFVLVSVLGVSVAKPSLGHGLVKFSNDGSSFSYSYETPVVHSLVHSARLLQPVAVEQPASVVVGPAVTYSTYGHVKSVKPANIQLSADGFVLDTEEVARARAEHLAAVAEESARAAVSNNIEQEPIVVADVDTVEVGAPVVAAAPVVAVKNYIEPANIQLSADGHVLDTYEVAQAKAQHLAQHAAEAAKSRVSYNIVQPIVAPVAAVSAVKSYVEPANIQVSADGHVLDTYEVAQAKAQHLAQYAAEAARSTGHVSYNVVQPVHSVVAPVVAVKKYVEPANIKVSADGHVIDTPEVAQAKAEHLAQYAAEAARSASYVSYDASVPVQHAAPVIAPAVAVKTYVQPANIQVGVDGHVLDTQEVAQAKAEHFARYAAEASKSSYANHASTSHVSYGIVQPVAPIITPGVVAPIAKAVEIADIKVSADGHVLDTPEVAQAKAAHFAQYASDAARAEAAGGDTESYEESDGSSQGDSVSVVALRGPAIVNPVIQYNKIDDPPADIKVSNEGFVLDTPEVAQAKSIHLTEVAKVASQSHLENAGAVIAYNVPSTAASYVAYTSPALAYTTAPVSYAQPKWFGPEADIKVGADGYLIDTPEVQQARAEHLATRASIMANEQSSWSGATSNYASTSGEYIPDTPEVVAARAAHLKAYSEEASRAASAVKTYNYGQLVYSTPSYHTVAPTFKYFYSSPVYRYLGFRYAPTAATVALTPDGQYLLDTPEVAAAKADHFAAHAKARGH